MTVIARGEVIVEDGELLAERGRGRFLPRAAGEAARPSGRLAPELDPATQLRCRAALTEDRWRDASRSQRPSSARSISPTTARAWCGGCCALLREAHGNGARLVVFPEMALTTFFPR